MKYSNLDQKKGVAGLNILLSLISMLFMIGIIVMVFVIAGTRLRSTSTIATLETLTTTDTGLTVTDGGTSLTSCAGAIDGVVSSVTSAYNETGDVLITSGNYTVAGCTITAVGTEFNNTDWNVTYAYTTSGTAGQTINDTYTALGDVVDWFPTFVVLGALVVLILLVVIIMNSIKSSGVTEGA